MKSGLGPILKVAGLLLCFALAGTMTVEAQNREKYVISAKAGGINQVTGDVTVRREGAKTERRLMSSDDLESGDIVSTGVDGRIEVLLNPGSYMRVSANAEFELTDTSLDSLVINIHRGNAIVEVASADDIKMAINIVTPQSNVLITKGGIYRFNVLPNETTEIFVRKGKLLLGKGVENQVKGGQKVVMRYGRTEVAKFDKKEQDTLDEWSKDRAKMLARANAQLQVRNLYAAFRSLNTWSLMGINTSPGSWLGAWVYNPTYNSYCFFPINGRGWSSPYGYGYTNTGWTGGANPYSPPTSGTGGGATGSGSGNGGGSGSSNPSSPPPTYTPPTPSAPPVVSQPPSPPPREAPSEPAPQREYTRQP